MLILFHCFHLPSACHRIVFRRAATLDYTPSKNSSIPCVNDNPSEKRKTVTQTCKCSHYVWHVCFVRLPMQMTLASIIYLNHTLSFSRRRAEEVLGYNPIYDHATSLSRSVEYYRQAKLDDKWHPEVDGTTSSRSTYYRQLIGIQSNLQVYGNKCWMVSLLNGSLTNV